MPDMQIKKFVKDLSHPEVYNRKHAAWMLARFVQKGKANEIVDAGAIPLLVRCLEDEMIVKYRAVWVLALLAEKGQKQAVQEANVIRIFEELADDGTRVETCHPQTSEILYVTLGDLAKRGLEALR